MEEQGNIIIYQSEDGVVRLDVRLEDKTVWLTIDQMSELFGKSRSTINEHILNIYEEGELEEEATKRKIGISDFSTKPTNFYNLDVIISVGYRVKSIQGTRFRQWATERLHEYIVKGFALDDERLKNLGGGSYWKELLDRIRDIRSSEKVLYRQVLDLYATAVDYDPRSDTSRLFFKIVQNKLHYAPRRILLAELHLGRGRPCQRALLHRRRFLYRLSPHPRRTGLDRPLGKRGEACCRRVCLSLHRPAESGRWLQQLVPAQQRPVDPGPTGQRIPVGKRR